MTTIDVEALLAPISSEAPTGENLEYDAAFAEMERAAEPKPEQQFGKTLVPGESSDWRTVRARAVELFARTKDLRAGSYLARAALHTDGIAGFAAGLAVIEGLLDRFWDGLHPALDEDGALMRANALLVLTDHEATLSALKATPLVETRTLGRFSLRDAERAQSGESGDGVPTLATIDAAFFDADAERLSATEHALADAMAKVARTSGIFRERAPECATDLQPLAAALRAMHALVADRLARRGLRGDASDGASSSESVVVAGADRGQGGGVGEIRSREDVVRVLDLICAYYDRHEPSSPVPILLRRAKRLVTKNFLEILRDLTPDGVSQAENLRGPDGND